MRNFSILLLLVVWTAACGASSPRAKEEPTLAPTTKAWDEIEFETESDLEGEVSAGESMARCTEVDPHPLAVNIAEKYDVSYESVIAFFCSGYAFDEILVALQTSGMSDRSPAELLAMHQKQSWDQIWTELGIVGP